MSTKDNWDDSSDDEEEGGAPTDPPHEGKYDEAQFVDAKQAEEEYQSNDDEFVDAKQAEEGGVGGYPQEDEWDGDGEDPLDDDYEDELDDYDKKLGRYVSCR
jgi:hypothetical protein